MSGTRQPRAEDGASYPPEYLEMHESVKKGVTPHSSQQPRTLLEVTEAIASNRESSGLFKNLPGLLHRVVRFDHLWLNLRDGAGIWGIARPLAFTDRAQG
jgi:hypothetical protein